MSDQGKLSNDGAHHGWSISSASSIFAAPGSMISRARHDKEPFRIQDFRFGIARDRARQPPNDQVDAMCLQFAILQVGQARSDCHFKGERRILPRESIDDGAEQS
jgi:hypothetical protein